MPLAKAVISGFGAILAADLALLMEGFPVASKGKDWSIEQMTLTGAVTSQWPPLRYTALEIASNNHVQDAMWQDVRMVKGD